MTVAKTTKCSVLSFGIEGAQFQKTFTITPENSEFGFKFDPKTAGKYEGKLLIEEDTKVHAFNVQIIVNSSI